MRILLINPPISRRTIRTLGPVVESLFYNSPPLGLCYLAAVLEGERHEVKIIDAAVEGLSPAEVIQRTADAAPDVIGMSTFAASAHSCYELAREIKARSPRVKMVIGGPHITSSPSDLLEHDEVDAAVIGEGEITFRELIGALEKGESFEAVRGLAFNAGGRIILTPARDFIADLDSLPLPARHLVPMSLYKPQPNDQRRLPKASMISSRGCPHACIFCDKNVFKNAYRSFSPRQIVREMSVLVKDHKARDIAFLDSTFTPTRERVYGIVEEIQKSGLDVTWTCSVRVDVVDEQLLRAMKKAGCWRVRLGAESGNEEVLAFIKKGITKYQIRRVARWAYDLDLEPKAFFMVGHLIDTRETIKETIDFACSLPVKDITVQMNTPLQNTPQYRMMERYGSTIARDFSEYTFFNAVFLPRGVTAEELAHYYTAFYVRFYGRPSLWYRHLSTIRSFSDIAKYLKGVRIMFFFFISWLKGRL